MGIGRIAVLLCALAGSVVVPVNGVVASEVQTTAGPPELGVAIVKDGRTIEVHRFVERMVTRTSASQVPSGVKFEVREGSISLPATIEVVPFVETRITKIEAAKVVARRIDGRGVPHAVLIEELAGSTPVVLATQNQTVSPLFAKIFKPESLVLFLPSTATPPTVAPGGANSSNASGQLCWQRQRFAGSSNTGNAYIFRERQQLDRLLLAGSHSSAEASRGRCRVAGRDRVQWSRRHVPANEGLSITAMCDG